MNRQRTFDCFNIDLNSDITNTTQHLFKKTILFFINEFKNVIKYDNKLITDFYSKKSNR